MTPHPSGHLSGVLVAVRVPVAHLGHVDEANVAARDRRADGADRHVVQVRDGAGAARLRARDVPDEEGINRNAKNRCGDKYDHIF